jgi:hypothetical protein
VEFKPVISIGKGIFDAYRTIILQATRIKGLTEAEFFAEK